MYKTLLVFCLFFSFVSSQTSNDSFNSFLKNKQVEPATVSFQIFNVSDSENVLKYNENKLLNPASLQKLITTGVALDVLGKDFKFSTKVNFYGEIIANKFIGIVEVKASGDPTLDNDFVEKIYYFLKDKNIDIIEGYLTVEESVFDKQAPKTWLVEDVANYYGATAYGFNFLKNTYKLSLQQSIEGEKPKIVSTNPYMRNLKFSNQLVSASENTNDNAYFLGMPFSNRRQIVGTIPAGKNIFTIKGAINNPAQIFKNALIKKFQEKEMGFVFNPYLKKADLAFSMNYTSKLLSEIVKETNQRSINLYAEALLKKIGSKVNGIGSTEIGIEVIKKIYSENDVIIYDGSGLSRKNLLTSQFLLKTLRANFKNTAFKNSLGVSGVSGTMKYFRSEKTKGKIYAKSGSADGILNYAGYFTNNNGEQFAFVLMVNSYIGDRKELRKKMVTLLEKFL